MEKYWPEEAQTRAITLTSLQGTTVFLSEPAEPSKDQRFTGN
jgi:hypothetical protein